MIRALLLWTLLPIAAACASAADTPPQGAGAFDGGGGEGEGEAAGAAGEGGAGGQGGAGGPGGAGEGEGEGEGGEGGSPLGSFGEECERAIECRGGHCVDSDEGKVCSRPCANEDDCPEAWLCVADARGGVDAVYVCFPDRSSLCAPCQGREDCLGQGSRCLGIGQGSYCGRPCDEARRPCPDGFECRDILEGGQVVDKQCIPWDDRCGECIDDDGDDYGVGPECLGTDCNDDNPDIHPNADEVCNQTDDDCDSTYDEDAVDFNLCGACGPAPEELCDGLDQDCDGEIDEAPRGGGHLNQDCSTECGEGQAECLGGQWLNCSAPPALPEVCGDGVDNNCDGIFLNQPDQYEPNNLCGLAAPLGEDPDIIIRPTIDSVDDRFDHFWFRGKDNTNTLCAFRDDWKEHIHIDLTGIPAGIELRMRVFLEQDSCDAGFGEFAGGVGTCDGHPCFRYEEDCGTPDDGNFYIQIERLNEGFACGETYTLQVRGLITL